MNIVGHLTDQIIPRSIGNRLHYYKDMLELRSVGRQAFDTTNLCARDSVDIARIFDDAGVHDAWRASKPGLDRFNIPDGTGGVNPGDRRAVFYLVNALQPENVLEIGTHIGASSVHIASALHQSRCRHGIEGSLVSVDIADVNCPLNRQWERFGASNSPREMIELLGFDDFVTFVTGKSLEYAAACEHRFDFIFLDGDHSAETVYREVSAALKLLNPGGVILLHDYFPDLKPLWSNDVVVTGPFMGTARLLREGVDAEVVPLGRLPWPTKLDSSLTSLALFLKKGGR